MLVINEPRKHERLIKKTQIRTKTIEGKLSINAARKIKNAIRWLIASSDWKMTYEKSRKKKVGWKINMCTLTFHENLQDDNKARKLLSQWLEMAKYRWELQHYIWKAEPQERGAIHFHLTTGIYIPHTEIKYTWNRLLSKHGLNSVEDNSTDIHAIVNVKSHENYLSEYFLNEKKHEGRRKIKGRLWGCSHGLSQAGKQYVSLTEDDSKAFQYDARKESLYNKIVSEHKQPPAFLKWVDVYLTGEKYYQSLEECELKKMYNSELEKLRTKKRQYEFWKNPHA